MLVDFEIEVAVVQIAADAFAIAVQRHILENEMHLVFELVASNFGQLAVQS